MLTTLLGVAAVVCAIGWLKNRLALLSILYYIMWAELPEPSDDQILREKSSSKGSAH